MFSVYEILRKELGSQIDLERLQFGLFDEFSPFFHFFCRTIPVCRSDITSSSGPYFMSPSRRMTSEEDGRRRRKKGCRNRSFKEPRSSERLKGGTVFENSEERLSSRGRAVLPDSRRENCDMIPFESLTRSAFDRMRESDVEWVIRTTDLGTNLSGKGLRRGCKVSRPREHLYVR